MARSGTGIARLQDVQEGGRRPGRGDLEDLHDVPPRDEIPARELLEAYPGQRVHIERVDLDEIPGPTHRVGGGLADRVGPRRPGLARRDRSAARFDQFAALPEPRQNPPDH
jgi:hypothetical protein